ncbi:MAG TPA: hypothetical protein VGX76_10680 [Pirellulales bacterium]|nr:hypothetical protein [Pirellulales bacterium]
MTKTKSKHQKHEAGPAVVLFGLGDGDKPRAAYFSAAQAALAIKAAEAMKLSVLKVESRELSDLAGKLPAGRVHANGRGLVPFVRSDLFGRLTELAKATNGKNGTAAPTVAASAASSAAPSLSLRSAAPRLPTDWDQIDVGDLIVAQDTDPEDGWWEAIVTDKNGDMVTVRWRQFPRQRPIVRHRLNLARLCPAATADTSAHGTAQPVSAAGKADRPAAATEPVGDADRYPATWEAIRPEQVVVAKEDGPFQGWWEAIVADVAGDSLTLRWRNRPQLPLVVRHRQHVALMLPKAT